MFLNEGFAAVAALAATTLAAPASTGQISKTIHLRAHVPVYCNVGWFPQVGAVSTGGTVDLGMTEELCNAPRGYRVILQHPTDVPDAAIVIDANRIPLSDSGETVLSDSDQPGFHVRQLAIDVGSDPEKLSHLGLRIEAKY